MKPVKNIIIALLLIGSLCLPMLALAAFDGALNTGDSGFGGVGQNIGVASEKWAMNLEYVAIAFGIGLATFGVVSIVKSRNGQGSAGQGAAMLIAGIALSSIIALLGTGSATLFGTDQTADILQQLQHK